MTMENLIKEIKMITETFEFGDESGALGIIEALNSDPLLIKDVRFDDRQKNKELVKALDGLSEFKTKFEDKFPNFDIHIYVLRGNAR